LPNINGRRDRHDIVAEILETAIDGAVKTHIMYKAKLSYGQVSEYIPMLVEKSFLKTVAVRTHQNVKRLFKTTELGEKFPKNLRAVDRVWSSQRPRTLAVMRRAKAHLADT
jgi:predicted transcriptional regulator